MSQAQSPLWNRAAADADDVRLRRDERGRLFFSVTAEAEPIVGVHLARCFPWSLPDRYISVRDADGNELCLLRSAEQADPETRRIVQEELAAREFVPRITAVHSVDDDFEVMAWRVETDRGPIELQVKSAEDIRQLDERRVVIQDHAGGLFEVPDVASLDSRSRRLLEDHLA
jgi:hypothetical protein